jgi:UDP-2,4-diacetamido-2,4,6-trideoxy-beta-L-altropyranose hydrolase
MRKNLYVLVDASQKIGSGHLMRCLTLTRELNSIFNKIIFITSKESKSIINNIQNNFEIIYIDSMEKMELGNFQDELKIIKNTLEKYSDDENFLLIDHYGVDSNFESSLKNIFMKIFVIDDLADRKHYCDLLIDHGYYKNQDQRYEKLVSKKTIKLLGPQYAIIKPEFRNENKNSNITEYSVKNILITFGSVDSTNECEKILDAICMMDYNKYLINVIAGAYNPNFYNLEKKYKKYENIKIFRHTEKMESLMANSDLCIGAGGTTTFERFCSGLPSIVTIVANNQKDGVEYLSNMGYLINLGLAKDVTTDTYARCIKNLDSQLLYSMSLKIQNLIDGLGCSRIKKEIKKIIDDV